MSELPEYLKELEELEKKQCRGPWSLSQGYLEVCDDMGMSRVLSSNLACLTELQADFLILCRNYLPRIIEDFKQLQKDRAELIKALESFKKYAEWSSGDSNDWPKTSRACGAGCDMGGAGEPMTDTGHDSDCPIERAREVLERMKQKKTIK